MIFCNVVLGKIVVVLQAEERLYDYRWTRSFLVIDLHLTGLPIICLFVCLFVSSSLLTLSRQILQKIQLPNFDSKSWVNSFSKNQRVFSAFLAVLNIVNHLSYSISTKNNKRQFSNFDSKPWINPFGKPRPKWTLYKESFSPFSSIKHLQTSFVTLIMGGKNPIWPPQNQTFYKGSFQPF